MKVKITCPVPEHELQAGLIYDVPDELAFELIEEEKAIVVIEETPVKSKKVKHDNG